MKALLTALASIGLLAAPLLVAPGSAEAQSRSRGGGGGYHGGGHGSGGGHHGGGHYGGGRHGGYGGHYHGGYDRGYGGYWGGYGYWGGVGLGLTLGSAYSYPYWYGGYPGYYAAYPSYYVAPPVVMEWSETVYRDRDDRPSAYGDDSDARDGPPSPACGAWSWNAADDRYVWVPCGPSPVPSAPPRTQGDPPPAPGWRPPSEPRSNPDPF